MVKNYSLKDAFKALDEINDELIETSIVINGPLNESLEDNQAEDHGNANIRAFNIDWETDGEPVDLPKELYLELDEEDLKADEGMLEEIIANELSDQTGWLVNYFDYERIEPEKIVESKEKLTEETFSLSDEEGLKEIEEFKEEDENEEPVLTVVDTNADNIDEVASNEDAAGSFVFTCDKCGENIFRTLDELQTDGYERVDDQLFKLKNKDESQGEFYHCTKCGNDTFTGNKQLVLADVDAEVKGESGEVVDAETDINVVEEEPKSDVEVEKDEADIVVEESLDKKELTEAAEVIDDDIVEDFLSDRVAKVLDDAGILYGDIVEYPEHKKCNIVGVPYTDWEEAKEAIESQLGLRTIIPEEDRTEFDDEIEVFEESLLEALSPEKLAEFKAKDFFKDFTDNAIRKFISIYLDFNGGSDKVVTPEEVESFMKEEGLGLFALDNLEALRFFVFKDLAKKDPKFIEACAKYYPEAFEDKDEDELINLTFKDLSQEQLDDTRENVKKIYLELQESVKEVKEGFVRKVNGTPECSTDGENWEECSVEEFDELKDGGYEDVTEDLNENMSDKVHRTTHEFSKEYGQIICNKGEQEEEVVSLLQDNGYSVEVTEGKNGSVNIKYNKVIEEEFDDVDITDIDEISIDKAISEQLSSIYENFGSYKTTSAFLKDVENRIILEGKLTFTSNKEQDVKFILEALESDNGNIKFKLTCEDFEDINSELMTKLNEGLLEALESEKEEKLDEASSAEKKAFSDGGEATNDYIQGKAIARIKDPAAREAAVAAVKADRPEVAKQFYGDRKENQARQEAEKKFAKMQKAGLTEADIGDDWKYPEDCSSLEEYDSDGVSNIRYQADKGAFDAENISEEDEQDYQDDADGYIASICARAAWGTGSGNAAENKLALDFVEREYPAKVKVLRKYLGNNNSTVR